MRHKLLSVVFLLLFFVVCCLSGCGEEPNTLEDVKKYIEEDLGFKEYTVSEMDGYWQVTLQKDTTCSFTIIQQTVQQLFGVSYYLRDDYRDVAAELMTNDFTGAPGLKRTVVNEEDTPLQSTVFTGVYTNRASLEDLLSQMQVLAEHVAASEYPAELTVKLVFDHPLRTDLIDGEPDPSQRGSWMDDGDYQVNSLIEVTDSIRDEFRQPLILMANDLHYEDILAEFTREEICEAIAGSDSCIGICYGNPDRDSYVYYEDLCGAHYGKVISFPTFYEILKREGYPVEGTPEDYTFTGTDGASYELIYSTKDLAAMKLLKDGAEEDQAVPGHLTKTVIAEKTGLNLYIWKMNYQPNKDVYAEDGALNRIDLFYMNGEEMTYDTVREGHFGNTTDDYKYLRYYKQEKRYYIPVDIGWSTDNQSYPMVFAEYVRALGGTYEHSTTKNAKGQRICKASWKVNGATVKTKAVLDGTVTFFQVKKDGKKMEVTYMNSDSDLGNATFIICLPIDEFAELMGLNYEINQEEGAVYFY